MYKQAAFDIAVAIEGSFAKGIRHQDILPFNMVVYRVLLTDWSAGKVSHSVASVAFLSDLQVWNELCLQTVQ